MLLPTDKEAFMTKMQQESTNESKELRQSRTLYVTDSHNSLSKSISAAGNKSEYDAACKRLLSHKIILAHIMKNCLKEYEGVSIEDIAIKYIVDNPKIGTYTVHQDESPSEGERTGEQLESAATEDSTIQEGTVYYDIRFYAIVPFTQEKIRLILNVDYSDLRVIPIISRFFRPCLCFNAKNRNNSCA
jgi:hypothetical protein